MDKKTNEVNEKQDDSLEKESELTIFPSKEELEKDVYILRCPIDFEGHKIDKLDLSKMADLRGRDLEKARKLMRKLGLVAVTNNPDNPTSYMWTSEFLTCLFQSTTGITMDVIEELHSIDYILLIGRLTSFLTRTVSAPRKIS